MQHEFIRYNKNAIGRPEIFGMVCWLVRHHIAGGGDKGKPKENKDKYIDEEKMYEEDMGESMNSILLLYNAEESHRREDENENDGLQSNRKDELQAADSEEIDPLDAFMNDIDEQVKKETNEQVWLDCHNSY